MILANDSFATIVETVEQGRSIYLNIQKAALYLLSCSLGEVMSLFLAIVFMPHVASTLSTMQIPWVGLVVDAFPVLALGVDPMDKFIMKEKPRDQRESLLAYGGMIFMITSGMFIGTIILVVSRNGLDVSPAKAQAMALVVLSISQLSHALNLHSRTHSIPKVRIVHNKWLIPIMVFGIILQIAIHQLPILSMLLRTVLLDMPSWTMVLDMSSSIILIDEISKWVTKERQHVAMKIWYATPVDHWQVYMTLILCTCFFYDSSEEEQMHETFWRTYRGCFSYTGRRGMF